MTLSIFDFFSTVFGWGWKLLSWVADLSLRFFGAVFNFGVKAVGAVLDLMLTPFTQGIDWFWDCGGFDLRAIFAIIMWVLLAACVLLAVFAVGSNICRKYQHRIK